MMQRLFFMVLAGLLASSGVLAQAKLYKWVDKNGKTHYGDTIPAEYAGQGNEQLDKRGQIVRKTDAALTPEQVKARDAEAARTEKEKLDAVESQRRDKALLATYSNTKEIDASLQRNLGQLDVQISTNELSIKSAQGRLDNLKRQEAGFIQRKQQVPADITAGINNAQIEVNRMHQNVVRVTQEKDAMRQRFASDKARWRELKGLPPEAAAAPAALPAAKK